MGCSPTSAQAQARASKTRTSSDGCSRTPKRSARTSPYVPSFLPFLSHPNHFGQDVLKAYAAVRQPRAHRVWEGSRRAGDIYEFRAGGRIDVAELRGLSGYVWDHAVDADVEAAQELLVREGVFVA